MLELRGHSGPVLGLAYSPDGATLASASADGTARLWDVRSGALTFRTESPAERARCVAFSHDGLSLAVGFERPSGLVQFWKLPELLRREQWVAHERSTRSVNFLRNPSLIVSAGDDAAVKFWTKSCTEFRHPLGIGHSASSMAVSRDGKSIAAMVNTDSCMIYSQTGSRSRRRLSLAKGTRGFHLTFSPTESIACGLEKAISLLSLNSRRNSQFNWPAHDGAVLGVAFMPDGQSLLSAATDGLVKQWSLDGRMLNSIDWQIGELGAVAIAPDGLTAAVGGAENIVVWDLEA